MKRSSSDDFGFFDAVEEIADEWMTDGSHVNTDLVRASRSQLQCQKRAGLCGGKYLKIGLRWCAVSTDFSL